MNYDRIHIVREEYLQGFVGTSTIYTSLLGFYAKTGDWKKALDVFLTMQMLGVSVDQKSCRTLMKVYSLLLNRQVYFTICAFWKHVFYHIGHHVFHLKLI